LLYFNEEDQQLKKDILRYRTQKRRKLLQLTT